MSLLLILIAVLQPAGPHSDVQQIVGVVGAGVGLLGVGSAVVTNRYMLGKFHGVIGQRLDGHDRDIADLAKSRDDHAAKINAIDREVGEVKAGCAGRHGGGNAHIFGGFHD